MQSKKSKFTKDDILRPIITSEYIEDGKKTIIGWLVDLYLYIEDERGYLPPNPNRKNYDKSISLLRKYAGLTKSQDVLEWEQRTSESQAAKILNKIITDMK